MAARKDSEFGEHDYLVAVDLDEKRIVRRSPNIEQERAIAIFDILRGNRFRPLQETPFAGPYRLLLGLDLPSTLVFSLRAKDDPTTLPEFTDNPAGLAQFFIDLKQFRTVVRDYYEICGSYFDAIKRLPPAQIEALDMARRGIHNEGAEQLAYALRRSVAVDSNTARRLFALLCVLHLR